MEAIRLWSRKNVRFRYVHGMSDYSYVIEIVTIVRCYIGGLTRNRLRWLCSNRSRGPSLPGAKLTGQLVCESGDVFGAFLGSAVARHGCRPFERAEA
jgi:hypothetical protein